MDCGGCVTTFEYVIPDGLKLAMVAGAALIGAHKGPPTMVKPGARVSSTGTSSI